MNARTATISLIAALLLGAMTWFALRPNAPAGTTVAIFSRLVQATNANQVSISDSGGSATLTASPDLDTWLITSGAGDAPWPCETGAVQGSLRMLRDLARVPGNPAPPPPTDTCTRVVLTLPDQADVTLLVTRQSLGGKTKAYELIEGSTQALELSVPSQTAELFTPQNVRAWRRADLLAAPGTPTEVRIVTSTATLAFKQVEDRWTMMLPVPAPVDPAAMKELLDATLPAQRLLSSSEPTTPAMNLRDPVATITRTTRVRTASGSAGSLNTEIMIGAAADPSQQTFYASASARHTAQNGTPAVAWGPIDAIVEGSAITAIAKSPEYYASKRSVQVPSVDVSRVRVLPALGTFDVTRPLADTGEPLASLTRTFDGWTRADKPMGVEESERLMGVIRLLCETPCVRVHLQGLATPVVPVCVLAVSGASGGLLENIGVGTDEAGSVVYLRSGRVVREYSRDQAGVALEALRAWTR